MTELAEVVSIPTALNFDAHREAELRAVDELMDLLQVEFARLHGVDQAVASYVEHVRAHRAKGWNKTPMRSCCGLPGFEQLVEALEG